MAADLRRAVLTGADLRGANLTDADLTDADLSQARVDGATFTRAKLTGARLDQGRAEAAGATFAEAWGPLRREWQPANGANAHQWQYPNPGAAITTNAPVGGWSTYGKSPLQVQITNGSAAAAPSFVPAAAQPLPYATYFIHYEFDNGPLTPVLLTPTSAAAEFARREGKRAQYDGRRHYPVGLSRRRRDRDTRW